MTRSVAQIAAAQFANRRAYLTRQVAEGKLAAAEANQRLLPWLAIASAAGAELDELFHEGQTWRSGREPRWQRERLRIEPCDICRADRWRLALAQARDSAIREALARPQAQAQVEALELTLLATALRVPVLLPATEPERKAA